MKHVKVSPVARALLLRIADTYGGLKEWRTGETVQASRLGMIALAETSNKLILTPLGRAWVRKEKARTTLS